MFSQEVFSEMLTELNLIEDEIESCTFFLCSDRCSDTEKEVFHEMLNIALIQREQIGVVIDDYVSLNVGISDATNLLCA